MNPGHILKYQNNNIMERKEKRYRIIRNITVICIALVGIFWIVLENLNSEESTRFSNMNRNTACDSELEKISSPSTIALWFNNDFHLDSIILQTDEGKRFLSIPTVCYNWEVLDYSQVDYINYPIVTPEYNEENIDAMERLANINYYSYRSQFGENIDMTTYIFSCLPEYFSQKVYRPLLKEIFGKTLFIRTSSKNSVIKAVSLNKVGRITSIYFYNSNEIWVSDGNEEILNDNSYKKLVTGYISDENKDFLMRMYKYRIEKNSIKDGSDIAQEMLDRDLNEIRNYLLNRKVELLKIMDSLLFRNYRNEKMEENRYPSVLRLYFDLFCGFILLTGILIIITIVNYFSLRKLRSNIKNRVNPCH